MRSRILYNTIREYTPKYFGTIPYSQTVKPTFIRKEPYISTWSSKPFAKKFWRGVKYYITDRGWTFQLFVLALGFLGTNLILSTIVPIYVSNNTHRTFKACKAKIKAYKIKCAEEEAAEEAAEAAAAAAAAKA